MRSVLKTHSLLLIISNALIYSEHLDLILDLDRLLPGHDSNIGNLRLPHQIQHPLLHHLLVIQMLQVLVLGLDTRHHLPMRVGKEKDGVKAKVLPDLKVQLTHGHNIMFHGVNIAVNVALVQNGLHVSIVDLPMRS